MAKIKTLVIYPGEDVQKDSVFHLFNPDTGEVLASHFCSGSYFAKSDLHDNRPERLEKWEKDFGMKTKVEFVEDTKYNWDDIYKKNQELKPKNNG